MKYLFYSDLHIRPERLDECALVLDKIGELALKHDATIVNGGDTFHTRGIIRTNCFDVLFQKYSDWFEKGLKQIILVGNHDQEDRAGEVHPMRVFGSWDGWAVVDKPCTVPGHPKFMFFPYMKLDEIQKWLTDKKWKGWDAVVHWGIRGAKRNDWNVDTDGVPVEWLSSFRNVFSGHYHFRNRIENVQYIGSPLQQNFGEMGQNKGVLLYDQANGKTEFIEIEGTTKHFEIVIRWEDGKRIVERSPDDPYSGGAGPTRPTSRGFVRKAKGRDSGKEIERLGSGGEGRGDSGIGRTQYRIKVIGEAHQVAQIDRDGLVKEAAIGDRSGVTFDRHIAEKSFSRLNIETGEVHNVGALMRKYTDFVDTSLDKERLLKVGMELVDAEV